MLAGAAYLATAPLDAVWRGWLYDFIARHLLLQNHLQVVVERATGVLRNLIGVLIGLSILILIYIVPVGVRTLHIALVVLPSLVTVQLVDDLALAVHSAPVNRSSVGLLLVAFVLFHFGGFLAYTWGEFIRLPLVFKRSQRVLVLILILILGLTLRLLIRG